MTDQLSISPETPTMPVCPSPDITIIIVSYNTRVLTLACLRSIYEQTRQVSFEIIVVDNHSTDGSVAAIQKEFPSATVIANDKNLGFAAANNQGLARAKGRYLLLLNSDTEILDGALDKIVAFAELHPEAGIIGCRALSLDGSIQYNCFKFPSLLNIGLGLTQLPKVFPRNRFFGRTRLTWWNYDTVRRVDAVAGCFMLVPRQAFQDVGPMAEDYFMYSEDTDWCWRFAQKGWKTLYTPHAVILHVRDASASRNAVDMHLLQRRSVLMFLEKKSGKTVRRVANAMFCLAALLRLATLGPRRLTRSLGEKTRRQWDLTAAALRFHWRGQLPDSMQTNQP